MTRRTPFMHRDLELLAAGRFDLLVVGGGICGLIAACDAAQRGLQVALIERGDFGGGSSGNHLRTIHGGLRYLQTMDIARARESIRERRTLGTIAPSAVAPLPFALPLTLSLSRGKTAMRIAFGIDRVLAADRNDGVPASHRLPAGHVASLPDTFEQFPELREVPRISGAAVWHDYIVADAERLTMAWAQAAVDAGAAIANYVEGVGLVVSGDSVVSGVKAVDRLRGDAFAIDARVVVNATGAGLDRLLADVRLESGVPMIHAMNFVTSRAGRPYAFGGRSPSGRNLFAVPYQGRLIVGTWESHRRASDAPIDERDIREFLDEINGAFPGLSLKRDEITLVQHGVVPGVKNPDGTFRLEGRELIQDHALSGVSGLISVAGTKYTTARLVAEHVVNEVVAKLAVETLPCRTAVLPLPVVMRTGDDGLAAAARDEMAHSLEDVVMRRMPLGALGNPGDDVLAHAADVVGDVKGWDLQQRRDQVSALREHYGRLKA